MCAASTLALEVQVTSLSSIPFKAQLYQHFAQTGEQPPALIGFRRSLRFSSPVGRHLMLFPGKHIAVTAGLLSSVSAENTLATLLCVLKTEMRFPPVSGHRAGSHSTISFPQWQAAVKRNNTSHSEQAGQSVQPLFHGPDCSCSQGAGQRGKRYLPAPRASNQQLS